MTNKYDAFNSATILWQCCLNFLYSSTSVWRTDFIRALI